MEPSSGEKLLPIVGTFKYLVVVYRIAARKAHKSAFAGRHIDVDLQCVVVARGPQRCFHFAGLAK